MADRDMLAKAFEENRKRLRSVAFRMLGSRAEADDAIQEAWLRLSRAEADQVENLGGWLTTVVARVCLDMLRSRRSRREETLEDPALESAANREATLAADHELVLADSVGLAMLVVLETLNPAERVSFVLHDMFDLPFEEIAPIVGRTPTAARQLASRARRRVQGTSEDADVDRERQREVVDAFLRAAREGDFEALLAVLDPDVVARVGTAAAALGSAEEVRGASDVAKIFVGRAKGAQPALIDGAPGLVWAPGGHPRMVFSFTTADGMVTSIELISDAARLGAMDLVIADA
ncbi:MAG TPA: sigma-70 family RNA polymerase sigma factor [Gemmatimonadaceae bacterium]|jgi:RNA polymerase sigma-70 factor (ECF subfamily)|nr:sigma-70 family RNA polymerase sigma factor [Gemmatimonadaceae bacterium]